MQGRSRACPRGASGRRRALVARAWGASFRALRSNAFFVVRVLSGAQLVPHITNIWYAAIGDLLQ